MSTTSTATRRLTTPAANWRDYASCREVDPELFFPVGTSGPALKQIEQAKAVCQRCPSMEACLDWALDTGQYSGVWGGLAEAERRRIGRTRFSHIDVCRSNRELIEQRLQQNASLRDIGAELGVGHWAVKRAVAEFRAQNCEEVAAA
jgi:WhiB family redox-sensing transcriptional regulator